MIKTPVYIRYASFASATAIQSALTELYEQSGEVAIGIILGVRAGLHIGEILPMISCSNQLSVTVLRGFPKEDWIVYNNNGTVYSTVD
jgi:hypothetical protein